MPAQVTLTSQFVDALAMLYAKTAFATEDGNNSKYLTQFSYAGGSSSYSFGLYQYDVGANPLARTFLLNHGFSQHQIDELSKPGGHLSQTAINALNKQLAQLLSTPAGSTAMTALNTEWFKDNIEPKMESLLATATENDSSIASQLYSSPVAIQHVLDLVNQFSPTIISYFSDFISGDKVQIPGGLAVTWNPNLSADANVQAFIMDTPYGVNHHPSEVTRENAFAKAIAGESITPTQIEVSTGTGSNSMSVTLDDLQNVIVHLDAGIMLSTGAAAQHNTFIMSNGTIVNTASNNTDVFTDGNSSFTLAGTCSVDCSTQSGDVTFTVDVSSSSAVEVVSETVKSGAGVSLDFVFGGTGSSLKIDNPTHFTGTISNFAAGDTIDLAGIAATGATLGANNVLTIQESGGGSVTLHLAPTQNYAGDLFETSLDGHGGTIIGIATLTVTPVNPTVNENAGSETFTITRSGDTAAAATVYVSTTDGSTVSGESINSGDFTPISNQPLTFAAGVTSATVSVVINDLGITSGASKIFGLEVTNGTSATANVLATDHFTIVDNDQPSGSPTTVTYTYSGPNGSGQVTGVGIGSATSNIAASISSIQYDYAGTAMSGVVTYDPLTSNVGNVVLYGGGNAFTDVGGYLGLNANGQVISWGLSGTSPAFASGFNGGEASITGNFNGNPNITEEYPTATGGYQNLNAQGSWTADTSSIETTVMVSPLTGQTQQLAGVLANPTLAALGAVQTLTISGPGEVVASGIALIPDLVISGGGDLVLAGGSIATDPTTVDLNGNISGYGTLTGSLTDNGIITASGGTLVIAGSVSGSGALNIAPAGALELKGTVSATNSVNFSGSGESLIIGSGADVLAPISSFGSGDIVGFAFSTWSSGGVVNGSGTELGLVHGDAATPVSAGSAVLGSLITAGATLAASSNVVVDSVATYTNAAALASALISSSGHFNFAGAGLAAKGDAHMLIAYSTGSGVDIADVEFDNTTSANQSDTANLTVTASDMVHLAGVSLAALTTHNVALVA